ncbi:MAG: hypothetical protein A2X08_09900 [Bacteroidetes bacterium GWA2_32_17]|nr:MAG: hypothetical protein A2X08_09900 [Bacteroidetes bacterium GWA2_32_17]
MYSSNLYGQHSKPDTLIASSYDGKIKLDGQLTESCWLEAVVIDKFTQREQCEGSPATEKTRIAVVYNSIEIYFGIWCFDSEPDKISAQQIGRDFSWGSDDNVELMISPFNDNRNGYLFVTNPNGALADVWVGDEGNDFNKDWNGVWDVAVNKNEQGWFVEMVIPFSTFKFTKDSIQVWGINFERNIRRKKEQVLWQGWSRLYEIEKISQGGKLFGINNIQQEAKIEIKPYMIAGTELTDNKPDNSVKIGGEVNFDITQTFKLNFTVNTDFAQVELDRKQINLSRFSLYYPEKRQFFLEGKNYYDMNVGSARLFYSRRIGIDQNNIVPIIGGARLFGKLNQTNIGVMSLQTYLKDTIPTTNYSIIRIKQNISKQSSIGFITTQKYSGKGYNRVYGADITYSTSEIFGNKNLIVGGEFALSETKIFVENENIIKNNLSYNISLSYPNDVIEYDFGFTSVEKGFNPEMGFTNRKNYQMFYTELQFNPRFKNLPFFRNLIFKPIDINYYINEETKTTESVFYEWRPFGFVSKSGEFMEFNIQHVFDNPDEDFELIDSIYIPAGKYWDTRFEIQSSTFRGRKFSAEASVNIGEFYTGHRQEYALITFFNFNKHLNVSLDWQRNYIDLPEKSFTTDEIGGRIDYAFSPKLQTGLFAQWNNEDNNILVDYRINWIPKIGSFFYFVINQEFNTKNTIKLERTTIVGKLIWRFAI